MVNTMRIMKNEFILWVYALMLSALTYITPIIPILLTVGLLIMVDTVLGVWASIKKQDRITSNRAGRTISKIFVYQTVLLTLFVVEQHIWGEWIAAVKIAAGAIAVVETISILENSGIILGEPVFKFLINKLGSKSNK